MAGCGRWRCKRTACDQRVLCTVFSPGCQSDKLETTATVCIHKAYFLFYQKRLHNPSFAMVLRPRPKPEAWNIEAPNPPLQELYALSEVKFQQLKERSCLALGFRIYPASPCDQEVAYYPSALCCRPLVRKPKYLKQ